MRRAGDILRVFLDRNTADEAERYQNFFAGWRQVVGERIAAHSEIKDLHNGTVVVEVDHPGWIQMIQLRQVQIVDVLRERYPELAIRGLRLQLPWKRATLRQAKAVAEPIPQPDEPPAAPAPQPADPLIRGALERLGKAIEERRRAE